jgi:O-acetyl-ADP-ribose deacetylase (regulator of RNase III)
LVADFGLKEAFLARLNCDSGRLVAEDDMTIWTASVGDLLDVSADALVCSANPQLNLSGGVGGEFLRRFGPSMQQYLHDWLARSARRHVSPGSVVVAPSCGSPFRTVIHAVAIDAFYDTSADLIAQAYSSAFAEASRAGCHTIATACLACGYGRATPEMFAAAILPFLDGSIPGIDRVDFRSTNAEVIEAVDRAIASLSGKQ